MVQYFEILSEVRSLGKRFLIEADGLRLRLGFFRIWLIIQKMRPVLQWLFDLSGELDCLRFLVFGRIGIVFLRFRISKGCGSWVFLVWFGFCKDWIVFLRVQGFQRIGDGYSGSGFLLVFL